VHQGKEGTQEMNAVGKVLVIVIAFFVLMLISSAIAGVFALFGASPALVGGVWLGGVITNTVGLLAQSKRTWDTM